MCSEPLRASCRRARPATGRSDAACPSDAAAGSDGRESTGIHSRALAAQRPCSCHPTDGVRCGCSNGGLPPQCGTYTVSSIGLHGHIKTQRKGMLTDSLCAIQTTWSMERHLGLSSSKLKHLLPNFSAKHLVCVDATWKGQGAAKLSKSKYM